MKLLDRFLTADQLKNLLSQGESVKQNVNGHTALHAAVLNPCQSKEKIKLLVEAGVDVNGQDNNSQFRNTVLHIIIANEEHETGLFFIQLAKEKIDYSLRDSEDKTPLIIAAKVNATSLALAMLDYIPEASVVFDAQDNQGMTAIHYACLYGNQQLADALIRKGASTMLCNHENKTAIDCTTLGQKKIESTLKTIEIESSRDENAIKNKFVDKQGLSLLTSDWKPVVIEAKKSNINQLKLAFTLPLIDSMGMATHRKFQLMHSQEKAQILKQANTLTGRSLGEVLTQSAVKLKSHLVSQGLFSGFLLRKEAADGHFDSVVQLVKNAPRSIDEPGKPSLRTALQQAAINNRSEICFLLIENGADLTHQDVDGNTALHLALLKKHFALAKELVARGADISVKNKAGSNALTLLDKLNARNWIQVLIETQKSFVEKTSADMSEINDVAVSRCNA